MDTLLITPNNKSELKLITDFLEKLNIKTKILSDEEIEDSGLSVLMKQVDRSKKVSRETIMKKLR
jgi:hypothetical protein